MKGRAKPARSKRNTTPPIHALSLQEIDELEKEVHAMRKIILTGALFARLTRKDRLTLPYSYY
ncbi:cittilin family RiPP precursor [Streptomyces sp. NPDC001678]|uniref:cittilin family RiPP precursor n=1 Tax=Streptomyces sp. NPDC001678 TaxID=3364599 RepID=UPI0036A626BE